MTKISLIRGILFCAIFLFAFPLPAFAIFDFGGWVLNVPTAGGAAGKAAVAAAAATGTTGIYPPCVNGLEEVNLLSPPLGIKSPPVLFQFKGAYTFSVGPAKFVGQKM